MAEGSFRMESESYNAEDMDEGSDEFGEEEMVEGNEYEEFGAFGGYGTFTSFDIRLLRAFGSLGPGLRILAVRPLLGHLLALLNWEGRLYAEGSGCREGLMGKGCPATPNLPCPAGRKRVGEGLGGGGAGSWLAGWPAGWPAGWRRPASTGKHDASVQSCLPSPTLLSGLAE